MNRIEISSTGAAAGHEEFANAAVPAMVLRRLSAAIAELYCRRVHKSISLPVAGKYRCWKCLREFEVDWD